MPFTPAHAAFVLPLLKRRRLSAVGLIVGSMVPDFEYFLKMKVNSIHSHTLGGVLYFDLPVSFMLSWIFIRFVKENLVDNLPPFLQRRFQPVLALEPRVVLFDRWLMFSCSVIIGSLTHLFWDGFTHNNTFFVRNLSFYKGSYIPYAGVKYPLWYALQHISSVVGLLIILVYVVRLPVRGRHVMKPNLAYWVIVAATGLVIVWARFQFWPHDLTEGNIVVSAITGVCGGLVAGGMINFNGAARQVKQ